MIPNSHIYNVFFDSLQMIFFKNEHISVYRYRTSAGICKTRNIRLRAWTSTIGSYVSVNNLISYQTMRNPNRLY